MTYKQISDTERGLNITFKQAAMVCEIMDVVKSTGYCVIQFKKQDGTIRTAIVEDVWTVGKPDLVYFREKDEVRSFKPSRLLMFLAMPMHGGPDEEPLPF